MSVAKPSRNLNGLTIRLRSVTPDDADFIVSMRSGDSERFRYLNPISPDIETQVRWIEEQRSKEDDYYFVIEDLFDRSRLGLISIYDIANGSGEWGRWIVNEGSTVAVESVYLLMRFCFDTLGLDSVYCRTIADNDAVVRFHDGYATRVDSGTLLETELRGTMYRLIEHRLKRNQFDGTVGHQWMRVIHTLFARRMKTVLRRFDFHHIGIATRKITDAASGFAFLGYKDEASFEDPEQGVRGLFMTAKNQPRLELLENLEGSCTLDSWQNASVTPYHFAYHVEDIDAALAIFSVLGVRAITSVKRSIYFAARIVFLVLPNRFIIELIETPSAQ